jgi:hypothetical protein
MLKHPILLEEPRGFRDTANAQTPYHAGFSTTRSVVFAFRCVVSRRVGVRYKAKKPARGGPLNGGRYRDRTYDPTRVKGVLSR